MAAVDLKLPPIHAPGENVSEFLRNAVYVQKGPAITYATTSPAALFNVPANTFVVDVIIRKTAAFDSSTAADDTVTIGDSDDADRFMAASDVDCRNTGLRSCRVAEGSDQIGSGGWIYTSAITINATITVGDDSNGAFTPYLLYKPMSDRFFDPPYNVA